NTHFPGSSGLQNKLVPDIGFVWGDRSGLRTRWKRRVDLLVIGTGEGMLPGEWIKQMRRHGIMKGFGETDVDLGIQPANGADEWSPDQKYVEGDKWHLNPTIQKLKYWRGKWTDLGAEESEYPKGLGTEG